MPHLELVNVKSGVAKKREGKFAHFCPEWDEDLIDETDGEFMNCVCKFDDPDADRLRDEMWERHNDAWEEYVHAVWEIEAC